MCGSGEYYHDFQEYALTEVLDKEGNPVMEEGGIGEIVSTPFTNPVTPLIRYRTGDLAQVTFQPCPCGRAHRRIKKILGAIKIIWRLLMAVKFSSSAKYSSERV